MLIHTFPPRRMCRVIAIRAASICRLVTYACSSAWMPYSPKATRVPPLAAPVRLGRCCLRCAVLRGMSISALLARGRLGHGGSAGRLIGTARAARPGVPATAGWRAVAVTALAGPQGRLQRLPLGLAGRDVAAVDPDLHPDPAERRARLVEAVVDVGPQGVQRDAPLAVELGPGHLGAAKPSRTLHPDAAGVALHGGLHRLAH